MDIEVNNIKIHYEVLGNGKPVILLNPNSVNTGLMKFIANRLKDKEINIEITDAAKDIMVREGYDPIYGARPLKRFVTKKLETLIAEKILKQEIKPSSKVVVDCENNQLVVV